MYEEEYRRGLEKLKFSNFISYIPLPLHRENTLFKIKTENEDSESKSVRSSKGFTQDEKTV